MGRRPPDIRTEHHASCEGHIECPHCRAVTCARPVVWRGEEPDTVICMRCFKRIGVFVSRN